MATPLIFPSLSRQPSMDSSKTIEDDTIRDPMENGAVATRPRGTRARRTWPFNVRNLVAEDIRVIDEFAMSPSYAARGGNSFLYPNLLPNWSFEFPALSSSDLVDQWTANLTNANESISVSTGSAADGSTAVQFTTVNGGSIPPHTVNGTVWAGIQHDQLIPCLPGEVYQFTVASLINLGTLSAGQIVPHVHVIFYLANQTSFTTLGTDLSYASTGWLTAGYQFTVPSGAAYFAIQIICALENSGGSAISLDGSSSLLFDTAGCALLTPLTPYGRMVGSQSLGCFVRFSKMPETADIGWGGGVKRYGAKFELTEV